MEEHSLVGVVVVHLGNLTPPVDVLLPNLGIHHPLNLEGESYKLYIIGTIMYSSSGCIYYYYIHTYLYQFIAVEHTPSSAVVTVMAYRILHLCDRRSI